ncbi:MAG: hypothetical protein MJ223_02930 [Mycoplasmoidaceae bacterium]|nr:hypothetical protein [Mycoplasmoidaceae bacterium]
MTRDLTSSKKPVTILVMGGDGSVNEVLNGINDFGNTTIGILPFGSGNDFFKSLGIKNSDITYLINEYANNTYVRKVDHLLINNKYRCMNAAGLGMSAEVVAYRNSMKHFKPATQYKIATMVRALA